MTDPGPSKNRPLRPPHALILEATFRGHKGTYVRWLCQEMLVRGWSVSLGVPDSAPQHSGFVQNLGDLVGKVQLLQAAAHPADGEMAASGALLLELRARLHHWRLFRRLYQQAARTQAPDVVFVPFLDYCLAAMGLLGSPFGHTPWSGILLRPQAELLPPERPPSLRRVLRSGLNSGQGRRALRLPNALPAFTIDPRPIPIAKGTSVTPLTLVHDPVVPPPPPVKDARIRLGIPEQAFVVLLFGAIRPRKGLRELVEAAATLPGVHVLCAGEQDEICRQILKGPAAAALQAQNRLHVVDRYTSDDEQELYYSAADAGWLVYQGYPSMSGVLMQSAIRGLPVLCQDTGLMGESVPDHELGLLADHRNPGEIRRQLQQLQLQSWDRAALQRRATRAFRDHSPEVFAQRIVDVLEQGIKQSAPLPENANGR